MQNMPTISQKGNKKPPTDAQRTATKLWQRFLNINADGLFGPGTHAATVAYQKAYKGAGAPLTPDGIVGPKTWATVPDAKAGQTPTAQQQTIAAVNAATVAAQNIAAGKPPTPKPQPTPAPVKPPAPAKPPLTPAAVLTNPIAALTQATQSAVSAGLQGATQVHVVVQKQPLWIRIGLAAGMALGAIAGFKALTERRRPA